MPDICRHHLWWLSGNAAQPCGRRKSSELRYQPFRRHGHSFSDDYRSLIEQAVRSVDRAITLIPLDTEAGPLWLTDTQPETVPRHVPTAETAGLLMYTSGTTGNPKGVILTHKNLLAAGNNVVNGHNITAADTGMCVLPIYHINGLCVTVMGTLVSASGLVIPYRFSVSEFWRQVRAYKVSWFSAVPTLFAYLLNEKTLVTQVIIDRDRLRFCQVGIGASIPGNPPTI